MPGEVRATQGYVDSRDVSLRDYFESRLEEFDRRLDCVEKAIEQIETDIKSLNITRAMLDGKATQGQAFLGLLIAVISMVLAAVSLLIKLTP